MKTYESGYSSGWSSTPVSVMDPVVKNAAVGSNRDNYKTDPAARDALFGEFSALVRKLIGQYGDDPELRHDLEGEIYYRFCTLVDVYEPEREIPLRPYLVRQLTSSTYTFARRQWRDRHREIRYDEVPSWISSDLRYDPTAEWDDLLVMQDVREQLPAALAGLPPRQKNVVIWRYFDELSFEQIADNLNVKTATARSLLRHALKNLRRIMRRH
jgi:RNA polymerase sigma factor (sigma-70 family)